MQDKYPAIPDELLPPASSAGLIGVSVDTLKRYEKQGRIKSVRTPLNHRRYWRSEVLALLSSDEASA